MTHCDDFLRLSDDGGSGMLVMHGLGDSIDAMVESL
jgi:hypothetical protein